LSDFLGIFSSVRRVQGWENGGKCGGSASSLGRQFSPDGVPFSNGTQSRAVRKAEWSVIFCPPITERVFFARVSNAFCVLLLYVTSGELKTNQLLKFSMNGSGKQFNELNWLGWRPCK